MDMNSQDLLLLRLEIDALNSEFAYLIDHDQSEQVPELFTEDGVYGRSTGQRSVGREAIRAGYKSRKDHGARTARHIFSNLRLTPLADGLVGGSCILTLYARDGLPPHPAEPLVIADYDDIYQRGEDGRWRFKERIITWIFAREGASSPLALGAKEKQP
jgi:ketosteroid isomerase-like protein